MITIFFRQVFIKQAQKKKTLIYVKNTSHFGTKLLTGTIVLISLQNPNYDID